MENFKNASKPNASSVETKKNEQQELIMCYDSLAEEELPSQPNSISKLLTPDSQHNAAQTTQPFIIDQQITVALPTSPMPIEDDEEGDFGPASEIYYPRVGTVRNLFETNDEVKDRMKMCPNSKWNRFEDECAEASLYQSILNKKTVNLR